MIGLLPSLAGAVQETVADFTPGAAVTESGAPGSACASTSAVTGSEWRPPLDAISSNRSVPGAAGAEKDTFELSGAALTRVTAVPETCRQANSVAYWLV